MNSWLPVPYRITIIGSGISGLAAAQTIIKHSSIPCKVKIIEAQSQVGGWLNSTRFEDGTVMEHGPRTARSYGLAAIKALNIISELNIDDLIIGIPKARAAAKRRFIYANKEICELPSSFVSMATTQKPLSKSLLSSIIKEPFIKKGTGADESVHSFFSRRLGKEIADYMSDPLCRGIFGGDARKLSLRSCFPILSNYENNHGSIIKGAIFSKSAKVKETSNIVTKSKAEKWMAWTLKGGMQTLPEVWSEQLKQHGVDISLNTKCKNITFNKDKIQVKTNSGEIIECEKIISTIPSCDLSSLIQESQAGLSNLLSGINYANMAVITLKYDDIKLPVEGFGVLVPSMEPCDILGITFDSLVIPQHAKGNSTILTVMSGGAWFSDLFGNPNNVDVDMVKELAVRSIHDVLGVKEMPSKVVCKIHKSCIPQYEVGHSERVERINNFISSYNIPLTILGNMVDGVGVNDVIVNSTEKTLKWLASNHMY